MNAQPSAMSKICHHSNPSRFFAGVGVDIPVIVGSGAAVPLVPLGTLTRSERQTPNPATTVVPSWHFPSTHAPWRRTCVEPEHARQLLGPGPEQLEQVESHGWQEDVVESKYWDLLQTGRQRPLRRTGRLGGQLVH